MNIRSLKDLMSDFDGDGKLFTTWKQQFVLLKNSYRLDHETAQVLMSTKLKGRALTWFHSKPEHLTMTMSDLLERLTSMFDDRPKKLNLRREFESRTWQRRESFTEYFHDKVILANRVPVDEEELTDYLIDGIPNESLQNQARMMRFADKKQLLEAFRKISLNAKGPTGPEQKRVDVRKNSEDKKKDATRNQPTKCFNCFEVGHQARVCPKPKRPEGACFECHSTSHKARDCPKRAGRRSTQRQDSGATTANLLQAATSADVLHTTAAVTTQTSSAVTAQTSSAVTTLHDPYMVKVKLAIDDRTGNECNLTVSAILDPGSPISLIKKCCVPPELCEPAPHENCEFFGVNKSRLKILGMFERDVEVEKIPVRIKFHIVRDDAISYMALLGRDFSRHPNIKITLEDRPVIEKREKSECDNDYLKAVNEILSIECTNEPARKREKLNVKPNLDPQVADRIVDMYEDFYEENLKREKCVPDHEMEIKLKHDQPIASRPRRLSYADKEKLREILHNLLMRGIIRPSSSPYASPIVSVRKKSGEIRLRIDYRSLNKITVDDNYPIPLIDDNIDQLRDKKYFSSLDLKDGYYHFKIATDSVPTTAFVTPLGSFEFLSCPFGLKNVPKEFARFLHKIFADLIRGGKILIFFDDILIATEELAEHLEILRKVFETAGRAHLMFRMDKCSFAVEEITYLGYRVSGEGIRPSDENIAAVINYPVPRNAKEALRFFSLASYFRRFIPHFSTVAKPLRDIAKENTMFIFGEKEYAAFEALKERLGSRPVLATYNPKAETELHCDASITGFGAILLQKQDDGAFRPTSFFSQRTTSAEAKYHSFELECLSVVYALKRYRIYLSGIKFKILTDCDSFRLALSKQEINPRIARWALFIQNFDYEIQHRPGKRMTHVDALSRCHAILVDEANTFEQTLSLCQNRDEDILKIRAELEKRDLPYYELYNGLVYRKDRSKKLLFYVPSVMEANVIRANHDSLGHLGLDKVVGNISKLYWFPRMREKVKEYISNCLKCIEFSPLSGKGEGYLNNISKGNVLFSTVHIDHLGPLEKSTQGYKHIFVVVDAFSKFIKLYPCKSTKSIEVIRRLREYFRAYSKPKRLVSDRGTAFTSHEFKDFVDREIIQHILVAVGTPRANGQVERMNRVIVPALAKIVDCPRKWDKGLETVEFALNNTICRSTGETPSRLLFGVDQLGETDDCVRLMLEEMHEPQRDLEEMRNKAAGKIEKNQINNKQLYDKKRKEPHQYEVGDYIMTENNDTTPGVNKKLLVKFKGPYEVRKVLRNDRYVVTDVDGFQVTQMPYTGVLAADRMKPYMKP